MALVVFNTLSRQKEEFKPLHDGTVGIYVCGPTVYSHSHLGHAKSYISFDVIVRYLRYRGDKVLYVQNITDVGHLTDDADEGEDKLEKQSRIDRVHPMQLAETYTRSYFEDMDALGVLRADIYPRASGHVTEQLALVSRLIDRGYAYAVNGSVYFDVPRFAGYGKLSHRTLDDLNAAVRIEANPEKRHPADFALWKKAEPGHIMRWPSPWGEGFPGWHIECSAMSMKYLGDSFDIHGGGLENQFPHHECEIAQSEGATGRPFVKYWLHNNMVLVNGRKMGKSLGNFITLKDAFHKWRPQVVRFFVLQSHYRSTLDFSDDALEGAARGLEKLRNMLRQVDEKVRTAGEGGAKGPDLGKYRAQFLAAMDDDFNTPQALAALFDLGREVNLLLSGGQRLRRDDWQGIQNLYAELGGGILGIDMGDALQASQADGSLVPELLGLLIALRRDTRSMKLWQLSDKIRDGLAKLGYTLEDTKEGTSWKKAP